MRFRLALLWMLFLSGTSALAQVSVGIGLPGVSIGINLPAYPELVRVPDYPVYYAPRLNTNFFFYDGLYWVYQGDNWYASSWYNGPWGVVGPEVVPLYVLRIPVRYYRNPPGHFRGWRADAPPRWGDHWGNDWQHRRSGWDKWNRKAAPAPAPLPVYQRQYSGSRYPRPEQQQTLHRQQYRYQPHDQVVRQHYQEQAAHRTPAPSQRGQQGGPPERPQETDGNAQDNQRSGARQREQDGSAQHRSQPPQRGGEDAQRPGPPQARPQQRPSEVQEQRQQPPQAQQGAAQRERQESSPNREKAPQGKGPAQEDRREQGQDKGHDKGRDKG